MLEKNVCIFTSFYPPHLGGVERYVFSLANILAERIKKVTIITFNTENLPEVEINKNVHIYRIPVYSLFKNRYPILKKNKKLGLIIKQILEQKPDLFIVNLRFYLLSLFASKLGYKNNIPVISIEHITGHLTVNNCFLDFLGHHYEHFITKRTKKYVTAFYGVSYACNEWLKHFNIETNGVLYNSVFVNQPIEKKHHIRTKFAIPNDGIVFITATRLLKEKGILLLIQAFKQIHTEYQNTYLIIIGDGVLYKDLVSVYNNKNNILLLGKKSNDEVLELIYESDIAVIPSYYPEGLPTLALEAGSLGKAVIATDVGGTKELIINEHYGLLIKPKSLLELSSAMRKFIQDIDLRINAGRNLQQRIKEFFTWDKRADEIIEILAKIK